jgi:DNA modification methylase
VSDVRLILGDCLDVLRTLEPGSVDAVVTDPPYGVGLGIGKDMRKNGHGLGVGAYASYADTYENFVSVIVPRLNTAINAAKRAGVFTGPHIWEQRKAEAIGGVFCPAGAGRTCWGFKTFTPVLLYGKYPNLHRGAKIPTVLKSSDRPRKNGHPCPKPLEWMKWLIELTTLPGETVLDPFMGSGTTGVACVQTGRNFVGVEIDPTYFAIAERRIAEARAAMPLFAEEAIV